MQTLNAQQFYKSEEANVIRTGLNEMMKSPSFNTRSTYSPKSTEDITFVDKHMTYLSTHPKVNPNEYMSNLRLMTRIN
ncbi:MAG: hypothetical protein JWN33_97 [Candidatus Saccharibacteria bacterium]|nr:hypothetical protein [Candidatus Saccharibacteria bacterium]